jgi:hypothetical protein
LLIPAGTPSAAPACDIGRMTAWQDVGRAEPEFAQRVRGLFDARRHKTIATVRADGSPRISGIEVACEDGELHSATIDPVEGAEAQWPDEAKISGRAIYARSFTDGTVTSYCPSLPWRLGIMRF